MLLVLITAETSVPTSSWKTKSQVTTDVEFHHRERMREERERRKRQTNIYKEGGEPWDAVRSEGPGKFPTSHPALLPLRESQNVFACCYCIWGAAECQELFPKLPIERGKSTASGREVGLDGKTLPLTLASGRISLAEAEITGSLTGVWCVANGNSRSFHHGDAHCWVQLPAEPASMKRWREGLYLNLGMWW